MRRIVWILLPITTFFFLLLVFQRFGLSRKGAVRQLRGSIP